MDYHIEKEYKITLTKEEYLRIKEALAFDEVLDQTNYYYDAHDPKLGMRIRLSDGLYTFTLKDASLKDVKESEFKVKELSLNDPRISALLKELAIKDPSYLGVLENKRHLKKWSKGELALDKSTYLNTTDNELEYELYDPNDDDLLNLETFLKDLGITKLKQATSKYGRFITRRKSMKVALFLANGHEECEALCVYDLLHRANIRCDLISIEDDLLITSSHDLKYYANYLFKDVDIDSYDALILPGGLPGTENLFKYEPLIKDLKDFKEKGKLIAAICAAPSIFVRLGFVGDREFTVFPGFEYDKESTHELVHVHKNIITARGLGAAFEFAHMIIQKLVDLKTADEVLGKIQYR